MNKVKATQLVTPNLTTVLVFLVQDLPAAEEREHQSLIQSHTDDKNKGISTSYKHEFTILLDHTVIRRRLYSRPDFSFTFLTNPCGKH